MNKPNFFVCLLIFLANVSFVSAQEEKYPFEDNKYIYQIYYSDFPNPGFSFEFKNNTFILDIPETDETKQEEGMYLKEVISSSYHIEKEKDFLYLITNDKKYLILYYENLICVLIDNNNYVTYCGLAKESNYVKVSDNKRLRDIWIGIEDVNSLSFLRYSSCLQETLNGKKIDYNGYNRYMWQIQIPWCEGKDNYGINEWIQKTFFHKGDKIILLNGYVDPNHIDYYYKNGRIKELEISTKIGKKIITLDDIPQLQVIDLGLEVDGEIRLKIKSVYEGLKYQDTCLSFFTLLTKYPR